MAQIQRTRLAEVDLLEIWTYIAENSFEAAEDVVRAIAQKCQDCAEFPGMGCRRDELSPGLRSVVMGSYLIFYRPLEDGIRLMRVAHGSRDLPSLFDQD